MSTNKRIGVPQRQNQIKKSKRLFLSLLFLNVTSTTKQQLFKMCHLRHRLRSFLFRRKAMFFSQDIQVIVFLTIARSTKSVTLR